MQYLIDVVIPVFNAASTIQAAVASIQNQTITDTRIVIVDDGSTDATPALIREIAAADSPGRLIARMIG